MQIESLTLTGAISTVAGIVKIFPDLTAYGIAATLASLDRTDGAAIDAAGNLYFSTSGYRILTVTASTGILTVVAGTGFKGFSGDGGLATSAALNSPRGIALDKFGNIFVADDLNHRIRKITVRTGIITTVAGDGTWRSREDDVAATSSALNSPTDVAVDTSGNIYIADTGFNSVRKVTASTGIITTLGGNGNAYGAPALPRLGAAATASSFFSPVGVAVDTSGNVFFTDSYFNSIYKITESTGLLTLVAGTNNWHYGYDGNDVLATTTLLHEPAYITLDGVGNIFFSDSFNHLIRQISASTGIISTVAGIVTSSCGYSKNDGNYAFVPICLPRGIAVDTAGSVYFCEGSLVRKVTYSVVTPSSAVILAPSATPVSTRTVYPTTPIASASPGIITTVAGNRTVYYNPAVDGSIATASTLDTTISVVVDAAGNLFISTDGDKILKVTASTGILTVVAGTGFKGFSGDGGLATSAALNSPRGIALDKFGNIFVADQSNERIRKITVSTGIITTVAGDESLNYPGEDNIAATSSKLSNPMDVAVDTYSNIYIADYGHNRVRKVTASTGIITTYGDEYWISVLSTPFAPTGVTVDTAGNVFTSDAFNKIYKITASTGLLSVVAGQAKWNYGYNGDGIPASAATLNEPRDITVDALGNIFFVDSENHRIRKITASTGIISTVAGTSTIYNHCTSNEYDSDGKDATLASFCSPRGIAVDTAGSIYLCDSTLVRKVTYSAVAPSSVVTGAPSVSPVSSITVTPTGGTPLPTSTATSTARPTSRPTVTPTETGSASMSSAPAVSPVSSITVSPTGGSPLLTPSASVSSASVTSSPSGSLSSSTTHIAGARYLMIILLSSLLILNFH